MHFTLIKNCLIGGIGDDNRFIWQKIVNDRVIIRRNGCCMGVTKEAEQEAQSEFIHKDTVNGLINEMFDIIRG